LGLFLFDFFFYFMKKIIKTPNAPLPIGPYNQAVVVNGLVFVSGQIALHPQTGALVLTDIETETRQVLDNVKAVLEAAGSSLSQVIKASVFVKDINQFGRINAVYATYFEEADAPARELVQVAELPRFVNIEISVIAAVA
jgi:2-iminobutanoate/2-iminopropanoate deaminase